MYRAGLLVLTQPLTKSRLQISRILEDISQIIKETLYIHIQPNTHLISSSEWSINTVPYNREMQSYIREFYSKSASHCMALDVRILLGHITNNSTNDYDLKYKLLKSFDTLVLENNREYENSSEMLKTVQAFYNPAGSNHIPIQYLKRINWNEASEEVLVDTTLLTTYDYVALGGTFDRLHAGHKVLLSEGCLFCDKTLTVGVSDGEMNKKKVLLELIRPIEERKQNVTELLQDIRPQIEPNVVTIHDSYGPTITDPSIQFIILSEEVRKGGAMINDERKKREMEPLGEEVISILDDPCHVGSEDTKVSSSSSRRRLLGTLYNPLTVIPDIPVKPYRIGLTGGICSGKSTICKKLQTLGAGVIDCDKLGHAAYEKDTTAYKSIVEIFGEEILNNNGDIDRGKLAPIVFSNKDKLQMLNKTVWPEIAKLVEQQIQNYEKEGKTIVILDAAVLLEAGWDKMVHEVWAAVIPETEAVSRIIERNKLSESEAVERVMSQINNQQRVNQSNVIFCSLWEYEYTQAQVDRAWELLLRRI